jgi:hypothetical protein
MTTPTLIRGAGPTATYLAGELSRHRAFLQKSQACGRESLLRGELAEIWEECRVPGWDGYDALPVTWEAYENASRFLLALPWNVPAPSLGAEPDGHITAEWHHSRRRTLSVSISPDDELHYAALIGPARHCGTEPFYGDAVPPSILDLIAKACRCSTR